MPKAPRSYLVLTQAKPGELPTEYLTDDVRFPTEGKHTRDLAKARAWIYPPGVRRFLKRHPHLTGYRRVRVPAESIDRAAGADAKAAADRHTVAIPHPGQPAPAAGRAKTGPGRGGERAKRASARSTKTDPNKRAKRAARKRAFRSLRKRLGKPKGRKPSRRAKVA